MKSVVEPLEGNKVKLSVTVGAEEFESAIDDAWKAIAREVRIPGFRAGKVPRKVLESRIEPGYARSEALQQAFYKISEKLYAQSGAQGAQGAPGADADALQAGWARPECPRR